MEFNYVPEEKSHLECALKRDKERQRLGVGNGHFFLTCISSRVTVWLLVKCLNYLKVFALGTLGMECGWTVETTFGGGQGHNVIRS